MLASRLSIVPVIAAFVLCVSSAIAQQAAPASRIVNPIDEKQLVTLKGTVHPLANARNDRGAAPDEMRLDRIHLVLKRSASQEATLQTLIRDMHTPGTAAYHQWLTPDEFGKQFGPSDQDIATVEAWLTGHGFNVAKVNPGKLTLEFSGNVRQFRGAFHAQIHKYEVNGETHFANSADPQIPEALSAVVGGFASLNNFEFKSYVKSLGKADYDPKTGHVKPLWTTGNSTDGYYFVLAPQDYALQYDLNPLYNAGINGAGQTIAIINEANINVERVNAFRTLFGLPANPPQIIIDGNDPGVDGINNPTGPNGASVEAYLDVEWAGAVAPNATVDLVIGGDTALQSGLTLAAEHAVYSNIAPVMSISFGECEANLSTANTFFNSLWEQAAAQGITVMVSSGDSGSAGCDNDNSQQFAVDGQAVNGFASTPYNVAVGGTDFYYSDYSQGLAAMNTQMGNYWNGTASNNQAVVSIKGVIPEQPWNDSQYGLTLATLEDGSGGELNGSSIAAGSGGSSAIYTTKPAWQTGFGDSVRDLPDVSLFASNGVNASFYPICAVDGDCQPVSSSGTVQFFGVGGTSASSPSFAGIMALVNQKYGRQGQADFVLYPLEKQYPASFNDVQNGTNSVPCEEGSTNCIDVSNPGIIDDPTYGVITEGEIGTGTTAWYNAVKGYDEASGLGTVDANQLVTNWNKVKFAATTTTLTPTTSTSFTHGSTFSFDGTVKPSSGAATGNVALMTDSPELAQQGQAFFALASGAYSGSLATLPGGTYNVWAHYGGDATNAESSSAPLAITVKPETSGTYLAIRSEGTAYTSTSAPGTNVDYGTQLLVSAEVAPIADIAALPNCEAGFAPCPTYTIPTGSVTFKDNSTGLATAQINAEGDAEYNAPFTVGAHSVTASYAGDNSYSASTGTAIPFTVVKDTPTVALNASIVDSSNGDTVNGPNQPTVLTVLIENTPQSQSGAHVPVAPPTGQVTLSSSLSGFNGSATLQAGVDPSDNAVAGIATFTVPAGSVSGDYAVTVTYNGDGNYNSVSQGYDIPIETTSGDGGLSSSIAATLTGTISPTTNIIVTGTVTGQSGNAAPTGSVYAYASGSYTAGAGLVPGSGDTSTFSIVLNSQSLIQGSNQIALQYFGDTNYNPSAAVLSNPIANPMSDFTLTPANSDVAVAAPGDAGTDTITVSSLNGFSGTIALSTVGNSAIGVTIPASISLSAGGTQTFQLGLTSATSLGAGNFWENIVATSSTGIVHTLGINLSVAGATAPAAGFGLTNTGNISVEQGATTGNTSTIDVTPTNGFTGTVSLTCAVTTIPTGATSPVTCNVPSSVSVTAATAVTAKLAAASTATTTTGTYAITVTGKSGAISATTIVTVTVTAAPTPSFALSNSGNIAVVQGATTGNTSTISATPSNGFTGTVTLSCAITNPPGTPNLPTCTIPSSVDITGTAAQTAALAIDSTTSTTPGAYTFTVTGKSGSLTKTTVVSVTISKEPTFSLSNSGAISLAVGSTTNNASTITVTPSGGFTGPVTLACAVTAPSGAASPVTCSVPSPADVTNANAVNEVLIVNSTATTTAGAYVVTVTGKSGSLTQTTAVDVTAIDEAYMISPAPGSEFSGATETFTWKPGSAASEYALRLGTTPQTNNLYQSAVTTGTSVTVTGLPVAGATVYATLGSKVNGTWQFQDYIYSEAGAPQPSTLTSPAPGSVLPPSATFTWSAGSHVTEYFFELGTNGVGTDNLYASGATTALTASVTGIPTTGVTVYARVGSKINGTWETKDYTYGTYTPAALTAPAPGSKLPGSTVTFDWTSGVGATEYALRLGTAAGANNLYQSATTTATSITVSGLPTSGATVYATLGSKVAGTWEVESYTYTEAGTAVVPASAPATATRSNVVTVSTGREPQ